MTSTPAPLQPNAQAATPAAIPKESVACAVCGSDAARLLGEGRDFEHHTSDDVWSTRACRRCGHLYLSPRPAEGTAGAIYPPDYQDAYLPEAARRGGPIAAVRRLHETGRYRRLRRWLPAAPRVLDLGCGDGRVLRLLRDVFGADAALGGMDVHLAPALVRDLAARGIACREGAAEDFVPDAGERYDLIVMTQLVEHLWRPRRVLERCVRALAPGGLLFVETPNPAGLCRRVQGDVYWGGHHRPRHLNLFTRAGLERITADVGLEVVDYREFDSPAFWIMGWRNRHGLAAAPRPGGGWRERVSFRSVPVLAGFTLLEAAAGALGLHRSNHRIVCRRPRGDAA